MYVLDLKVHEKVMTALVYCFPFPIYLMLKKQVLFTIGKVQNCLGSHYET